MFARILKSGSFHDVVGYVTRQFHNPEEYTPDTWRIIGSDNIFTSDYAKMVQSFEAIHGFMPGKENPAGHISISFDTADASRLTDKFMAQLAKEYMEGMGIKDTQYLIVRHLETGHPHFHIVYNRVNLHGKAVDERNNYKRSDKVVKAIKDKYGLTYSPLKQKYEDRIPVFKERISQAIYGCKSWDEFSRRLACAGIEVKFHDDHNTGKPIGVKFTDGDITVNGSKIDRAFTYRRLNNLFEFNRRHGQQQSDYAPTRPKVTVEYTPTQKPSLVEDVLDATVGAVGNLFTLGPGYDPQEEEFARNMRKKKKKPTIKHSH
jgi:hypothetical protein